MRIKATAKRIYRCSASRQGGFTLIELLIAVALTAVVAALAYGVLFQGLTNFTAESEEVEAQSNVRYALTYLSRQIRGGESVAVEAAYKTYGVALCVDAATYYYSNNMVYEAVDADGNGEPDSDPVPLVAGIGSIGISMTEPGKRLTMTITSIADSRGHTVTETMDIYLRE